jgi:hypothetical protein
MFGTWVFNGLLGVALIHSLEKKKEPAHTSRLFLLPISISIIREEKMIINGFRV